MPRSKQWVVVPRDPVLVARALATLSGGDLALAQADHDFEALVAIRFPKLHFGTSDSSPSSSERFDEWLRTYSKGEFPPLREKLPSVGWVEVALEREAKQ